MFADLVRCVETPGLRAAAVIPITVYRHTSATDGLNGGQLSAKRSSAGFSAPLKKCGTNSKPFS